jgi:hypothetical protein
VTAWTVEHPLCRPRRLTQLYQPHALARHSPGCKPVVASGDDFAQNVLHPFSWTEMIMS